MIVLKNNGFKHLINPRTLLLMCVDVFVLFCAYLFSLILCYSIQESADVLLAARLDFGNPSALIFSASSFVALCIVFMSIFGVYRNIVTFSLESSVIKCILGVGAGSFFAAIINYYVLYNRTYNMFTAISTLSFGLLFVCFERIIYSFVNSRVSMHVKYRQGKRCLIIGAGFAGQTVLKEMFHSKTNDMAPVCFVDDDANKINRNISNIPVYGPMELLPALCKKHNIETIIFAIPSCSEERRETILSLCSRSGCEIIEMPSLFELSTTVSFIPQLKTVDVDKLLNRDVVKVDNSGCKDFVTDKTVMVTGVGSIGSELCRQIVTFSPKKLVMVDIYENNAYDVQQELVNKGYGDLIEVEIASVRDFDKMQSVFKQYKPDVVFHAAAHKHVPLMEHNPEEAIKNNVVGTYNVAQLCKSFEVAKMVLISTDKAVNPTNVMGASKRCCEMIMQYMAQSPSSTAFSAVRFGNVLGSNGSVIPLFCSQIEAGGPVTVTHPDIIRYFMTIPEAVSLVLKAGEMSKGGEIYVLNMGNPVKITTLAENLIKMYGYEPYTEMPIKFVGLRPGEKLFEELLMSEENLKTTENKKIFIGNQIQIDPEQLEQNLDKIVEIARSNDKESVVSYLHEMVPTVKEPELVN